MKKVKGEQHHEIQNKRFLLDAGVQREPEERDEKRGWKEWITSEEMAVRGEQD